MLQTEHFIRLLRKSSSCSIRPWSGWFPVIWNDPHLSILDYPQGVISCNFHHVWLVVVDFHSVSSLFAHVLLDPIFESYRKDFDQYLFCVRRQKGCCTCSLWAFYEELSLWQVESLLAICPFPIFGSTIWSRSVDMSYHGPFLHFFLFFDVNILMTIFQCIFSTHFLCTY